MIYYNVFLNKLILKGLIMSDVSSISSCKCRLSEKDYHRLRSRFLSEVKSLGFDYDGKFFNPYRKGGAYHGAVQSLWLLGVNEWHSYKDVYQRTRKYMSSIELTNSKTSFVNAWDKFSKRQPRIIDGKFAFTAKDVHGRLVHNFEALQRLGGKTPYGYKLAELNSCIDIKVTSDGHYFRLNTSFDNIDEVKPLRIKE